MPVYMHPPPGGRGRVVSVRPGLGSTLARAKDISVEVELDAIAEAIESAAIALAAQHVETGDFAHSLQRKVDRASPSRRDRLVYSDDPAALSIEYGHVAHLGKDTIGPPRFVPGQHILGRAADAVT